ncbi:MAG: diguanylate cyclase [Tenericutes bacterium]|nr:diguanylate cyclase [Mycoplasmatota bacterium]
MLKNITIKNKLKMVLIILISLIIMSSMAFLFIVNSIIRNTEDLYAHPYTVSNMALEIKSNVRHLFSITEEITETTDSVIRNQLIADLEALEDEVIEHLVDVKELYLGDIQDVEDFEDAFLISNTYRDVAIALTLDGNYTDAFNYRLTTIKDQTEEIIDYIIVIENFANTKAIELTQDAVALNTLYNKIVYISSTLLIILSLSIFIVLIRNIYPEIEKILLTIKSRGMKGNILDLNRKDELGIIGRNLNDMISNIKTQSEIKELNMKLANLKDKENLRITLMSIGDGVITTDLNGDITNINPVASNLTGYLPIEAIGKNSDDIFKIVNKFSRKSVENPIDQVIKTGKKVGLANHTILISKDGKEYDVSDSGAPITSEEGEIFGAVLVFRDITAEYKTREEIEFLSWNDPLTGLKNRNYLEKIILNLEESKSENIGVIMGDVNGLKITNDAFGHDFGDQLLIDISSILNSSIPEGAIIARWGGDEFLIMLENATENKLDKICKKVRLISDDFKSNSPMKPSISLGHAVLQKEDVNLYRTLIRAEDMMYENKLLNKDSLRSKIVRSLEVSLYEKSYEAEDHALRVAEYGELIARKINLPQNEINNVILLCKLHDIGKISIDDYILNKPGKLDSEEWKKIKKHPEIGYRIASSLKDLAHIAEGILCHHEHYNGNGYPRGLRGEKIPISARITSIADAFDVMTTKRNYRQTLTIEEAINELIQCKGAQFDPDLVDVFIEELRNKNKTTSSSIDSKLID